MGAVFDFESDLGGKMEPKGAQMEPKWSPNGAQMGPKSTKNRIEIGGRFWSIFSLFLEPFGHPDPVNLD